ncbi:MAG: ABC transporter ATP-binding protein/permease [Lachnospiraceae bacterium]|nr:ABC transporter ATP-binding protein/permease [Lachnospiraceae bacterium]
MEKEKQQAKKKEKPKYNLPQNVAWMIGMSKKADSPEVGFFVLLMGVVSAGVNIAGLLITPMILKQVEDQAPLLKLLLVIGGYTLCLILLNGGKNYLEANIDWARIYVRSYIKTLIHEKFCKTSYSNIEDTSIIKKFNKAIETTFSPWVATQAIWHDLELLIEYVLCFWVYLYFLKQTSYILLAIITVTTISEYFLSKRVDDWRYAHKDEAEDVAEKIGYITEKGASRTIGKDIRIFGMHDWLQDIYHSVARACRDLENRLYKKYLMVDIIDVILTVLRNGLAYYYLLNMTLKDNLSASTFLLCFSAVGGFAQWIRNILSEVSKLNKRSIELCSAREALAMTEVFRMEGGKPIPKDTNSGYELRLESVSYRYPGTENDVISNLNLTIKPGEKVALVGLNGAGKTTLVKLICGFYDPTRGRVLLNGTDIREYNRPEYYNLFTAVFQQFSMVPVSIGENITQGFEEYDEQRVWEVLKEADLEKKVKSLPDGIHTHIGKEVYEDGIELSGGETQRLVLARALYKNAPILLLDEPTAALDPIAEDRIYQKYSEMTKGRTSLFISHRLASTRFCDRILFMENGKIIEEGSHDMLMSSGGKYKELFDVQSKYYQEGQTDEE